MPKTPPLLLPSYVYEQTVPPWKPSWNNDMGHHDGFQYGNELDKDADPIANFLWDQDVDGRSDPFLCDRSEENALNDQTWTSLAQVVAERTTKDDVRLLNKSLLPSLSPKSDNHAKDPSIPKEESKPNASPFVVSPSKQSIVSQTESNPSQDASVPQTLPVNLGPLQQQPRPSTVEPQHTNQLRDAMQEVEMHTSALLHDMMAMIQETKSQHDSLLGSLQEYKQYLESRGQVLRRHWQEMRNYATEMTRASRNIFPMENPWSSTGGVAESKFIHESEDRVRTG